MSLRVCGAHFFPRQPSLIRTSYISHLIWRENDTDSQYEMNDVVDDKTNKLIVVWRLVNWSIDNTTFFLRKLEAIRDG